MKQNLLLALFSIIKLAVFAQEDSTVYKPVQYPDDYASQLNVVYTKLENWEGKMDLYLPPAGKPAPVVINIHGGGWNRGSKESQTGFSTFFKAGFAVANIAYRLTPQATAPAAVEDARCALIYLIKNAKALNIDVKRIVVMGGSAGGHLALMAGMLANDKRFDGNCQFDGQVKVAAIIDKYGIADVGGWTLKSKSAKTWLADKATDAEFVSAVSPISYVNKTTPPVFIVHGDADPTVPYQQSVDLHQKLKDAGVITEFITVPGGLHGKFEKEKNTEINKAMIAFLKRAGVI